MQNYAHQTWNTGDVITSAWGNKIEDAINSLLLNEDIKGATQTPTYTDGQITQIVHKVGGTTVRTDTISYSDILITETRTLAATGDSLTLNHNFDSSGNYTGTVIS